MDVHVPVDNKVQIAQHKLESTTVVSLSIKTETTARTKQRLMVVITILYKIPLISVRKVDPIQMLIFLRSVYQSTLTDQLAEAKGQF
ncbi:hypothetical protein A2961_04295 [Candidatus Woesebacteria bacterium RIFCSPLOWO2_01_FULL_39_21]|uniref:Uncharacterized protein n=1 Tax=Candidatus Woesebacteria bacterium RIFCSPLOWO2_01_FULL_39_21 TaxID=1802519 RepID=A0A1F8BLA1_9BACT|nr:MAG: hypothetical protein A2691_01765 [Candidatus Woesebacteria bacterium RIFCSPHIGHO2_01_FULL_39_23]OGM64449.1 MAG: hypothetical protein A2961_04295 [Candidatus Woesebacteria bacterium RIFCSPLOWO2_01_FULL_39_21]